MENYVAVTFLLEQVTDLIKGHSDLISGANKEFKKLKDDIIELMVILKDTVNISSEDNSVISIKNKIREVIYEVEDAVDSLLTESKAKSRFIRGVTSFCFVRKVKFLREGLVKEMLEKARHMKATLHSVGTSKEAEIRMDEDWKIKQKVVVGLKDEKEKIKGYLMKEQMELDIISIVGMPGLGKTVLAREVFNDEKICYEFPIRIWVDISQRINITYVLVQIMKHFMSISDDMYSMSNQELCKAVHVCLSQDKFLLVMDDVWRTEQWDELKDALPYGNGRGKVLVTSREINVCLRAQHFTKPHQQRPLNQDESWELLQLVVFGNLGRCPDPLKEIGRFIAEKCIGIPITIVVLGGVLKGVYLSLKSDALVRERWMEVAEHEDLAREDKMMVILDVLAFSYHRLPQRSRECFLYLGVFPPGYEIQTWTLKHLWIAEGFIQPDENQSLEKTAEDILNDLIGRNLLMVHKTNPMREVKICRVHDFVRMFCIDEALKQNLFNVRMPYEDSPAFTASDVERMRRLCLHYDLDSFFSAKQKGPRVHSFLCFLKDVHGSSLVQEEVSGGIYENYSSLRILHAKSIVLRRFPPKLIRLTHLRYIVLCIPELDAIPDQISQLWNLQTIIIGTNSKSIIMRSSLWKMIRLRHLKTKAAIVLEKKFVEGDQAGENLQTLNRLSPESVPEVSRRATNLKTLGVRGKLAHLFEDMPLGNLNHLEKLKLYEATESKNQLPQFPKWDRFPPNLKRLTLSNTLLDWKHMSTLAMIPGLEVLKLKDNAFTGIYWGASSDVFPKLQILIIIVADLVLWEATDNSFPCLRHLELKNCEILNAIPVAILQRLENLDIDRVCKSTAVSAKNLAIQLKRGAHFID